MFLEKLPEYLKRGLLLLYLLIAVPLRTLWMQLSLRGTSSPEPAPPAGDQQCEFDVVCLSHVPWRHIWQRNHHTMMRLARNRKVLYVQTTSISYIHWFARNWPFAYDEFNWSYPGVHIVTPLLMPGQSRLKFLAPVNRWIMTTLVRWHVRKLGLQNPVFWFYYPGTEAILNDFNPAAVVYDIQDEYSAFTWAPGDISQREQRLLSRADIIFGGTHALYESKRQNFGGAAYFYPCAVEFGHFYAAAPALDAGRLRAEGRISEEEERQLHNLLWAINERPLEGTIQHFDNSKSWDAKTLKGGTRAAVDPAFRGTGGKRAVHEPAKLQGKPRPRLLYVGLIDKRIDPDLLAYLGQAEPDWQIIMVGPVDEQQFDQASVERVCSNVHFMGSAQYRDLPGWLAGCDVYLMPWKVNDLTRHINPTKTLEYMAAGRPVVSISLPDLENLFSDSVNLATSPEQFVEECREALAGNRQGKVVRGLQRAWDFAWDTVVPEMESHVCEAIKKRHGA